MILKIKNFLNRFRFLRKIRLLRERIGRINEENFNLKGMLIKRRKTIKELGEKLLKSITDLGVLAEKKKKGEILISQLIKRRDEFLKRLESNMYIDISSMADYKFFLSEPFIKDRFDSYDPKIDDVDRPSIIKGLGKVLDEMELKKTDEDKDESK